ncbi:cyclic dof factor 2 [Raphanus sativus]|uniref:Cyclic dof factor 2 n=1 Tax=Raphanus sativus TaxID=3726 RepID=A0A6J0LEU4_RAPSA|nr:cyclic dof factor 2 [Raphanus sativus]
MSDPAIKLFGNTIPLPELVGGDSSSSYTGHQHQNPVRLSDSCTGDDEEMGDSGLAGEGGGDDGGFHGRDSESEKDEKDNQCGEESMRDESSN